MTTDSEPATPRARRAYQRSRFTTRLPEHYFYTRAHWWIAKEPSGSFRMGFTRFATRMLGELVEIDVPLQAGAPLSLGESFGTIEGFKALSELYSVLDGRFLELNPALLDDPELLSKDCYERGWIYRAEGQLDPEALSIDGYAAVLDATIDKMLEQEQGLS